MAQENVQMIAKTTVQRSVRDPNTGAMVKKMLSPGTVFFVDEAEAKTLVALGGATRSQAVVTDGVKPATEAPAHESFTDDAPTSDDAPTRVEEPTTGETSAPVEEKAPAKKAAPRKPKAEKKVEAPVEEKSDADDGTDLV